MPGEDTPAQHNPSQSVTDADVQRLLNIALACADMVEGLTPQTPVWHHHLVQRIQYPPRQAVPEICRTEHGLALRLCTAGKAGPILGIGLQAQGQRRE